jgi:uncharacterized protein DUF4400
MAGSRFVRHLKLWFFTVPLIGVFVMPAIPDRSMFEIPDAEVQSVTATIGEARADQATRNANALFKSAFVDSGLVRKTVEETSYSTVYDAGATDFARTWVHNFWMMMYRAVYRATVMKLWLLGTVAFWGRRIHRLNGAAQDQGSRGRVREPGVVPPGQSRHPAHLWRHVSGPYRAGGCARAVLVRCRRVSRPAVVEGRVVIPVSIPREVLQNIAEIAQHPAARMVT